MISCFEIPENLDSIDSNVGHLWKTYLEKDEKYRNDRLKMIARVADISLFLTMVKSLTKRSMVCEKACWKYSHNYWSQTPSEDIPRRGIYRADD